jgi:hypothetical protein
VYEFFFLYQMLDVAAVVASEHGGGGGGNKHAPVSMLIGLLLFCFSKPYWIAQVSLPVCNTNRQ